MSSGDLEVVPLMFHYCAMFLTCMLVVLKPVISLVAPDQPSFVLALTDDSGPA